MNHYNYQFTLIALILLFICSNSSAQSFEKGLFYSNNGDSTIGFIKEERIGKLCKSFVFKKSEIDTQESVFKPFEVEKFELNKQIYESKEFLEGGSQNKIFALLLVKGRMSLYEYDQGFLVEKNNTVIKLIDQGPTRIKGRDVIKKFYLYQLDSLGNDCITRYKFLNGFEFNRENLVNAVSEYNICKEQLAYVHKSAKINFRIGARVISGAGKFIGIFYDKDYLSTLYGVGTYIQFGGDKFRNSKFMFSLGVDLKKNNTTNKLYKNTSLSTNLMFQYALLNPKQKFFPYITIGGSMFVKVNDNYTPRGFIIRKFGESVPIGFGLMPGWNSKSKLKLSLELLYQQILDAPLFLNKNLALSVGLNF